MTDLPTLTVDDRAGSGELLPELRALGLPAVIGRLEAADFAFVGDGPKGREVAVGIERKRLDDVLACIVDARFAGEQLPKLKAAYEVVWLVVDDIWRADEDGLVEIYGGRKTWRKPYGRRWLKSEVDAWVLTQTQKAGVFVAQVGGHGACAAFVKAVYGWWCLGGGYDGHRSHVGSYQLGHDAPLLNDTGKFAAILPGVGVQKAVYVQEHFKAPADIFRARLADLASVVWRTEKGKAMRLGPATAMKIRAWMAGGADE